MKKFLVIYRMDMEAMKKMMETSTPEERQKDMQSWKDWMSANAANFSDMGGAIGKNTNLSSAGAVDKSNDIGGYSVIQAETKEAAMEILKSNPHFTMPGSTIDIAEIMSM